MKVNRTVPKVDLPPAMPVFSAKPTDLEFFRARIFEEPLVPLGQTSLEENQALARALGSYIHQTDRENTSALKSFLAQHPKSPWAASLLTNRGLVYRKTGYFTLALEDWERAWELSKAAADPLGRGVADRALAELAELNARLGRFERLEPLFAETKDRIVQGAAREKIHEAKQGLWLMRNRPEDAFRCGPMALDRILAFVRKERRRDPLIVESRSTPRGMSLTQVADLSAGVAMPMQMAHRTEDVELLLPAVIHWKAGHFAAVVKEERGRYLVQDPTFGDDIWVSRAAIRAEATGYFLVPEGPLPDGWRRVEKSEGETVWGKGATNGPENTQTCPECVQTPKTPCRGMATYSVHALMVSLSVRDNPVGYSPAAGPSVQLTAYYIQREAFQPQTFSYSNLGPNWTFDWFSYVEDTPGNLAANVGVYLRGGGRENHKHYDAVTHRYGPDYQSRAVVERVTENPIRYERHLPDGSREVFTLPDGAVTYPRKVLLTQWIDPQGNSVTLTYDGQFRLVAVTDALGQVTTLSYDAPGDSLKISRVTDPFGRFASFDYDSLGRLVKITDVIGLASEFQYGSVSMTALTTPYGTTQFDAGGEGRDRWIQITDPLGGTERVEYRDVEPSIVESESVVPVGMGLFAPEHPYMALSARNTFYWDKRAMARAAGDYNKARIYHWLHEDVDLNHTTGVLESEKMPLENRVWYRYPDQPAYNLPEDPRFLGSTAQPTMVGRVLDDGSTQLYQYEYNTKGNRIRAIDPVGRETVYVYGTTNTPDPNPTTGTGIELLQVKVKNGASPSGWDIVSSSTYNNQHLPLTRTDAAGRVTTFTYNAAGQPLTVVAPPHDGLTVAQRTTTYTYDTNGVLQNVAGPTSGLTTTYTYDGYNRVRTATDPDGYTVTYDYDTFDRPTRTTYPDGTFEETQYDRLDSSRRRDRLGRWTHTFYDGLRRVAATRDSAGRTITQQWCSCGSLDKLVDPNGNATQWERDLQGRVTKEIRANGSFKSTVYEATTSRVKKLIDAKLQEIVHTYAVDGKPLSTAYVNAEHPTPNVTLSYTDPVTAAPDAYGRLRQVVDGTGATVYGFVPVGQPGAGQLASVVGPLANDTVSYEYDELGRLAARTLNDVTSSWDFDAQGRLQSQVDPIGAFTYGYVGNTGRVQTVTYPNGQTTIYSYYPVAQDLRLQEIHHRKPDSTTLSRFNYIYDAVGNIKTWNQQTDADPGRVYNFEYDPADQLVAASFNAVTPPAVLKRYRYAYDPAGNRTAQQTDDIVTASSYDNMNRVLSQQPGGALLFSGTLSEPATTTVGGTPATVTSTNQFSGTAPVLPGSNQVSIQAADSSGNVRSNTYEVSQTGSSESFTYDPNGNLINDGTKTYEWDARDRLIVVKQGGSTLASFSYDGEGRRSTKTTGGVTTTFVYGGAQFLEERPSVGATKRYVYGPGTDQVLAQVVNGTISYNVADHLGSVVRTTDNTGAPTLTREYDPWGSLLQGSTTGGYAFTGREWDPEIGLYYYRARYYDPSRGRFASRDKALGALLDSGPYSYVSNAPSKFTDPTGMVQVDPAFPEPYRSDVGRAIRILSRAADAIPACNCQYKEAGGRDLKELLAAPEIKIYYDPIQSNNDLGMAYTHQGNTKKIFFYPMACRMGRWTIASYLAHELMHIALVPGPGQEDAAYTAQLVCGFELIAAGETIVVTP